MTPTEFKDARNALGLSVSEMADAIQISDLRTLRRYEDGTRPISGTLSLLIRYFLKYGLPEEAL